MSRRILAGFLGILAVLAGTIALSYAIMVADDFRNPQVSFWSATAGTTITWLLTIGAFWMAIYFLKYSFTGTPFRLNRWVRAISLGALSFFPGFMFSIPLTLLFVEHRWPGDTKAEDFAFLISGLVGVVLGVVVGMVLMWKSRPSKDAVAVSLC